MYNRATNEPSTVRRKCSSRIKKSYVKKGGEKSGKVNESNSSIKFRSGNLKSVLILRQKGGAPRRCKNTFRYGGGNGQKKRINGGG